MTAEPPDPRPRDICPWNCPLGSPACVCEPFAENGPAICRYCTGPILALSTGGPDVCVLCELYGVPPDVWMGRRAPWDFHAGRRGQGR